MQRFPLNDLLRLASIIVCLLALTACSGFKHGAFDLAMGCERRSAGLELSTLFVNEFEISVLEGQGKGERPTLVLVHGFGASKEVWLRLSRHLKDDFHIIAIDLPGHGDSSKHMDKDYDISSQVLYLRAILSELAVEAPHLAGNSLGGTIVTLYAARYPEKIASITLFNPGGVHTHESELTGYLARGENPLIVRNREDFDRLIRFSMEKKPFLVWPVSSVLAERAIANQAINEKMFSDIRRDAPGELGAALPHVWAPALIIWGRHDRLINVENGRVFEALMPDARLVILEDVGHVPMIETPRASAKLMRDFVLSVRNP